MRERRALERIEINQLALLQIDGICGCYPCMVVNFHGDGAMLYSSTHHTAAFKFNLSLDGFKTTKHCYVVWRNKNTCGVKFDDQKSSGRSEQPHVAHGSTSCVSASHCALTQPRSVDPNGTLPA